MYLTIINILRLYLSFTECTNVKPAIILVHCLLSKAVHN